MIRARSAPVQDRGETAEKEGVDCQFLRMSLPYIVAKRLRLSYIRSILASAFGQKF